MAGRGCRMEDYTKIINDINENRRIITAAETEAMTDEQLAEAVIACQSVVMPDYLNDKPNLLQRFVYYIGLNGAPQVMDRQHFDQFMQENDIPRSQIMSRVVFDGRKCTAQEACDIFKYSELTYIGGKWGGHSAGYGAYFEMNGGYLPRGYPKCNKPGLLIKAVYNPSTARVVGYKDIQRSIIWGHFFREYPKLAHALGFGLPDVNEIAPFYALALGYNALSLPHMPGRTYQVILDRSTLVVIAEDFPCQSVPEFPG